MSAETYGIALAQLDSLPEGSVVLDSDGDAWQKQDVRWTSVARGVNTELMGSNSLAILTPLTVVHRGGISEGENPTDEEVNAVALAYWGPSVVYDRERLRTALAGFRRSGISEPTASEHDIVPTSPTGRIDSPVTCETCGRSLFIGDSGGWEHVPRWEPQGEPSEAQVIGEWFTSSHGVAVAAVAPMTDRGPSVMVDGRVISPNDVAALVEFKAQGEPSDAARTVPEPARMHIAAEGRGVLCGAVSPTHITNGTRYADCAACLAAAGGVR